MAERTSRVGRTKSASKPARIRSDACRWGDRFRARFNIRIWCLRRSDSATRERTPPGPSNRARTAMKDEKNGKVAHQRIVAGRRILRNLGRNNNSPATGHVSILFERKALTGFPAYLDHRSGCGRTSFPASPVSLAHSSECGGSVPAKATGLL